MTRTKPTRPPFAALAAALLCPAALLPALLLADAPAAKPPASEVAAPAARPANAGQVERVNFTEDTLPNGLRVIYAPMHQAPVVHVRVLYHVGSRDERPDRQGFAHMFEHMMFRGSTHVPPEQHMKLIGVVGGESNAFTSFDQTTYVNTIPSNNVEMALYLEADRMASFKVSDTIFQTERKVVSEEWRMRTANPPLGTLYQDFLKTAFKSHSYRWTPIGDMDQLRQAKSAELQEFFNRYYVPNNACLIVAGDIDVPQTKQWVQKYYGWIPKGPDVGREIPKEPEQAEARSLVIYKPNVPLATLLMGFKGPDYKSDDHYALNLLGDILSGGRTGRLDRQFVHSKDPVCLGVGAGDQRLEDSSMFIVNATVQQGKDVDQVEKDLLAALYDLAEKGVTAEELEKVKTQNREGIIRNRQTCTQIASQLGEQAVFGGNAERVNEELPKLMAVTPADIQAVAKKYLKPTTLTAVRYLPDPTGVHAHKATTQAATAAQKADETKNAPVVASDKPIEPRVKESEFPQGYPTQPPVTDKPIKATFNKGAEATVNGVKVITITDHRLPLANFSLILRGGGDAQPADKVGLSSLTAAMMRRGSGGVPFLDLSQDLESKSINIEVGDAGDTTQLSGSCNSDQLAYAIEKANLVLTKPDFPSEEFTKLKIQTIGGLVQSLAQPAAVAQRDYAHAVYAGGPQGRVATPKTLATVTLEDVREWYGKVYKPAGAFLVISGDVSPEQGAALAAKLLAGFADRSGEPPKAEYTYDAAPTKRKVLLVDNPEGKQSTVRLGLRAYDIRADEKYAGSVAGQILSAGIESRLNKYVRAEKGLTYGCYAYFRPGRHAGEFSGSVDTNPETTAAAVEAMFKVFNDMRTEDVTATELAEAKSRVAGGMVMEMQTVAQQASRRVDQILNDYPVDYYDVYPQKVAAVTAEQVKAVMKKYATDDRMSVVVVAPAEATKGQLEKLGDVEVLPMPAKREGVMPVRQPTGPGELLQPKEGKEPKEPKKAA